MDGAKTNGGGKIRQSHTLNINHLDNLKHRNSEYQNLKMKSSNAFEDEETYGKNVFLYPQRNNTMKNESATSGKGLFNGTKKQQYSPQITTAKPYMPNLEKNYFEIEELVKGLSISPKKTTINLKSEFEEDKSIIKMRKMSKLESEETLPETSDTHSSIAKKNSQSEQSLGLIKFITSQPNISEIKRESVAIASAEASQQQVIALAKKSSKASEDRKKSEENEVKMLTNRQDITDFYEYTEECLTSISKLTVPSYEEIKHLVINLPFEEELKTKKLAIFDLDETLVHCVLKKPKEADIMIEVTMPNGKKANVGINIRPYVKEALEQINENYVCIMYTASEKCYADKVMDYLDPERKLIRYRLYRTDCVQTKLDEKKIYVKDLRIINNVSLKNMIIIDNSVLSFAFHLDNGIPILPFYDNKSDLELKFLVNYLRHLAMSNNLQKENKKMIQLDQFLKKVEDSASISYSSFEGVSSSDENNTTLRIDDNKLDNSRWSEHSSSKLDKSVIKDELFQAWTDLKKNFKK